MTNLIITERTSDNILILDLKGAILFGAGSDEFHRTLRRLVEKGEKKILLNLAEVSYIDSSGLGELIGGYVSVKKMGGEIKLIHLSPNVLALMELTKFSTIFDVHNNEPEAIKSFNTIFSKSAYVTQQTSG